jgi:hypothetical protein
MPTHTKAWYAKVSPERGRFGRVLGGRLFAGRHYRDIVLDDGALTVTTRHGGVVFEVPARGLVLVRMQSGLLLQVRARDADDETHVFEFRPRHHADGRALADALR